MVFYLSLLMVCFDGFFVAFSYGPTLFTWSRQVSDPNAFFMVFFKAWPTLGPWIPLFGWSVTSLPKYCHFPLHGWPKMAAESPDSLEASRLPTLFHGFFTSSHFQYAYMRMVFPCNAFLWFLRFCLSRRARAKKTIKNNRNAFLSN